MSDQPNADDRLREIAQELADLSQSLAVRDEQGRVTIMPPLAFVLGGLSDALASLADLRCGDDDR